MEIVESIKHFKKLSSINGFAEFHIILAGGLCRSSKRICYNIVSSTYDVYNEIDDSWQDDLTEKELYRKTLIPEAIENGALIYTGFQLNGIY